MCYKYHCDKCDKTHLTRCDDYTKRKNKHNTKHRTSKNIRTLNVKDIKPLCLYSNKIGSRGHKFDEIHTKKLFVDDINDFIGPAGTQGVPGPQGLNGQQGPPGTQGPKGDTPNSMLKINKHGALTISNMRNVPCNELFPVFFNNDTNELSCDSVILSYSKLIEKIEAHQQEIDKLKLLLKK